MQLREMRKLRGLTQEDVAGRLNITRATYTNYETGRRDPDTPTLIKLASVFDCSTDVILGIRPLCEEKQEQQPPSAVLPPKLVAAYSFLNPVGRQLLMDYAAMLTGNPAFVTSSADKVAT